MSSKQQALAELSAARAQLPARFRAAAERVRPSNILQQSIQKHRIAWAAGALVTGFLAVRMMIPSMRRKNERDSTPNLVKKSGFLALLAAPLIGMARKSALSYATRQVQQFFQPADKDLPHS